MDSRRIADFYDNVLLIQQQMADLSGKLTPLLSDLPVINGLAALRDEQHGIMIDQAASPEQRAAATQTYRDLDQQVVSLYSRLITVEPAVWSTAGDLQHLLDGTPVEPPILREIRAEIERARFPSRGRAGGPIHWRQTAAALDIIRQRLAEMENCLDEALKAGAGFSKLILRDPTIAIVTALPEEFAAVQSVLDDVQRAHLDIEDPHIYMIGTVPIRDGAGRHTVVATILSDMGNNLAASGVTHLLRSFPTIRDVIMVGIAAAPPNTTRLGDVVISDKAGVLQYDNTKRNPDGSIEVRDSSQKPSARLLSAVRSLQTQEYQQLWPWQSHLQRAIEQNSRFSRPDDSGDTGASAPDPHRRHGFPRIHYGRIGSANLLLKDSGLRDTLVAKYKICAFEMEGSGVADATWEAGVGYLVVRGICDYADLKKDDSWHVYAAVAAAAYARAVVAEMAAFTSLATSGSDAEVLVTPAASEFITIPARPEGAPTQHPSGTGDAARDDLSSWFAEQATVAKAGLTSVGGSFYRILEIRPAKDAKIDLPRLWRALASAKSPDAHWPLVLSFADQDAVRRVLPAGVRGEFKQERERAGPVYECVAAHESGALFLFETQQLETRTDGVFYYDAAIATAAEALAYACRFCRSLDLLSNGDIAVRLEYGGMDGRQLRATKPKGIWVGYIPKASQTDVVRSAVRIKLRNRECNQNLALEIEQLLSPVFAQFDLFSPGHETYVQLISETHR